MITKATILVTGASGKIGYEILNELIKKRINVIGTYSKKKFTLKSNNSIKKFYKKI